MTPTCSGPAKPRAGAAIAIHTTVAGPTRRTRRGATVPTTAKQAGGTDVSSPATVGLMGSPARMSPSRGPTLATAGRRLNAATASATPTRTRHSLPDIIP